MKDRQKQGLSGKRILPGSGRRFFACVLALCILAAGWTLAFAQAGREIYNESASVTGPVSVSTKDEDAVGIQVMGDEGTELAVTVTGDILAEAETDSYDHQNCAGVYIDLSGAGTAGKVTVDGNITSVNTWKGDDTWNLDTVGLEADVSDRGEADVTVNGKILARSVMNQGDGYTWSAGIHSGNNGGRLKLTVNGDVTAEGKDYCVGLNVKIETEDEASSFIQVNGDVTASDIGIRMENYAPDGKMEVLVNGTLSARRCISPEGDTYRRSLFTVWKAEPVEGSDIIPLDEDILDDGAREIEKEIQYIIRISDESAPYITVQAEDYHGFPVAREGETVPVLVQPPKGYEVAAVYGKPGNGMKLPKKGNVYELTVPKGGGIELSVSLRKAVPATGDRSRLLLWLALVIIGLAGVAAAGGLKTFLTRRK